MKKFKMFVRDKVPAVQFRASVDNNQLVIGIYGDIGPSFWGDGITAAQVAEALQQPSERISVRINSPGGDAFEGIAIYNLLKADSRPVDVVIDGLAASAASVIAMAGDTISMGAGTMLMIHAVHILAYGNGPDLRETADLIDKSTENVADIYAARSGAAKADVLTMLYDETWMTPAEAIALGFADEQPAEEPEGSAADVATAYQIQNVFNRVPESLCAVPTPAPASASVPTEEQPSLDRDIAVRELTLYGVSAR